MKPRRKSAKKFSAVTDSEGGIPLPDELAKAMCCKIGDVYACWKDGDEWRLVFPRNKRRKYDIPKDATWGKVERALPEILVTLPKPAKAAKVKKPKTSREKKADEMI